MNISRWVYIISITGILCACLAAVAWPSPVPVSAQAGATPAVSATPTSVPVSPFTKPELLFTSKGEIHTPLLLADKVGRLHLFWTIVEIPDSSDQPRQTLLYYSHYEDGRWSPPVNIMVGGVLLYPSAAIDSQGIVHLIYAGTQQQIFYTSAPLDKISEPKSWSRPVILASGNLSANIIVDDHDVLHVVYPGSQASGPYYIRSNDGGKHWSTARNISPTMRDTISAEYTRLAVSPKGVLHAVWSEFELPSGWPPTGIFYSQSIDQGMTWSRPKIIKGARYDQINILMSGENIIHVNWNAMDTLQGRYHSWSQDGGKTWSDMDIISDQGGTEGLPAMALDSNGTLHVVVSYDHCPYYTTWLGDHFAEPVCLLNNDDLVLNLSWSEFIEEPAMTIRNGNEIFVVFWDNRNRLFYAHTQLKGVNPSQLAPYATYTPTPALTKTSTPTQVPPTETPVPPGLSYGQMNTPSPLSSLALDLLPSVLLIGGVCAFFWLRVSQRR